MAYFMKRRVCTWGRKVTHFNPWVLKIDMIASMTLWWWLLNEESLRIVKRALIATVW